MKHIAKEMLLVLFPKALQGCLYFFLSVYVVNAYSLEAWGDLSLFKSILMFFVPVMVLAMPTILARDVSKAEDFEVLVGSALYIFLIGCAFLSLFIFFLSLIFGYVPFFDSTEKSAWFLLAVFGAGLSSILVGVRRGLGDSYAFGRQVIGETFFLILALWVCHLEGLLSASALIISFALSKAVSFLFVGYGFRGLAKFDFSVARDLCVRSIPLVPSGISFWFVNASDRLIIEYWAEGDLGYYSVGYELGYLGSIFISVASFVFVPYFSRKTSIDDIESVVKRATSIFAVFPCSIYALAVVVLGSFIDVVYGVSQEDAYNIYVVAKIVALATVFFAMSVRWQQVLLYRNRQSLIMWAWLISGIASVLLTVPAVILWGGHGAAITSVFCFFSAMILMRYFSLRFAFVRDR